MLQVVIHSSYHLFIFFSILTSFYWAKRYKNSVVFDFVILYPEIVFLSFILTQKALNYL